jgi:lipid-binding SYLF domain-containing protein
MVARRFFLFAWVFCSGAIALSGCASIPGKTRQEQIQTMDQLVEETLSDLYKQYPASREQIQKSVGYAVMSNKITKVPVFGVGAGYGTAVKSDTQEKTYLRMRRFDFGAGWGARSLRSIAIFYKEEAFRNFVNGSIDLNLGAEAAVKAGDKGAAGGGAAHAPTKDPDYSSYLLTDTGVSATATLGVIRVKPIRLKI